MNPNLKPLHQLEGLIDNETGELLYNLALDVPYDRGIVEIGSYHGKSTAYLALGSREGNGAQVYAVDPWELVDVKKWCGHCEQPTFEKFGKQLDSVDLFDAVIPIQRESLTAAAEYEELSIGLLFIDGDHSEKACQADFLAWAPHTAPNAIVVFDDYAITKNPGVAKAVHSLQDEFVPGSFEVLGRLAMARVK